jgi:hypothetical protein
MNNTRLRQLAGLPVSASQILSEAKKEEKQFYLRFKGGDQHSGPYKSEDEAEQALDKLLTSAKKKKLDDEEVDNLKSLKIVKESAVTEAYAESADFDAAYESVQKYLKDAKAIVQSANWKKHMKDTDNNFDTSCVTYSQDALKSLNEAIAAFEEFYDHIEKAA